MRQAQVYLANAQLGQAEAGTIAKKVQADRAEIYRAIIKLEKLGLTQRCLTRPLTFRAKPITEAFSILLQQNTAKHNRLEAEAKKLIEKFREHNNEKPSREDTQYRVTFGKQAETHQYLRDFEELQTSLDTIFDWKLGLEVNNRDFDKRMQVAIRGVKARLIANIPEDEEMPQIIRTLLKKGSFELKSASITPKAGISIRDKKIACIITLSDSSLNGIEVLRSNNPAFVELVQDYFDMKWQTATTPCWRKKNHQRVLVMAKS